MITDIEPHYREPKPAPKTIASLYPQLSPDEQAEADYNLKRYVALVWRIFQRLQREERKKFDDRSFKR